MQKSVTLRLLPLASITLAASPLETIQKVRTSEDLAKFIHSMLANNHTASELLAGLSSNLSLKIEDSNEPIPVKEVFGQIIALKYDDWVGPGLFVQGTHMPVRAICSFIDSKNDLHRYHITIFEEAHYKVMRDYLYSKDFGKKRVVTPLIGN